MRIKEYLTGIKNNNRAILAQAITLIESSLNSDKIKAAQLLEHCIPITKPSIRIGISGTPGVGKSTFIEKLGILLTKKNTKSQCLQLTQVAQFLKAAYLEIKQEWKN